MTECKNKGNYKECNTPACVEFKNAHPPRPLGKTIKPWVPPATEAPARPTSPKREPGHGAIRSKQEIDRLEHQADIDAADPPGQWAKLTPPTAEQLSILRERVSKAAVGKWEGEV